jgi:hypothetical protein
MEQEDKTMTERKVGFFNRLFSGKKEPTQQQGGQAR